jgi:hypothetical protein
MQYTPQQNGVAERKNYTITEMARSMLATKHFSNKCWAEVVANAVYIMSKCPTKSVKNIVPQESWIGMKHNVAHLNFFGYVAYAYVPDEFRKKKDKK